MATWAEVQELANKLKITQEETCISKLSERTWVDVIRHLINKNRLKLVFSTDGKSYLTKDELDKEIREEIEAHSGRINLSELAANLDIDIITIESRVTELISYDSQNKSSNRLLGVSGEVMSESYVRRLAHEIMDRLEEQGQTSIGELATIFSLPTVFITRIMQDYQGTLFRVHKYDEKYITTTFLNTTRSKIRGYFTAIMHPILLSSCAAKLNVPENLLNSIVSSLINNGRLFGTLITGRGMYVPLCYAQAEESYVRSFFSQNGYIEWNYLKRFGITEPSSYLRSKIPDAVHVSGITVNTIIIEQLKELIATVVRDSSWSDLSHCLPTGIEEKQRAALISPLIKDLPVKSIDFIYLVSDSFIQHCETIFEDYITKKAHLAFQTEHMISTSRVKHGQVSEDDVFSPKRVTTSAKGGFGFGAREIKMKNVKKKYNPSKRRNCSNSHTEDFQGDFDLASMDSGSSFKVLSDRYINLDELKNLLASGLNKDVPVEVIDGLMKILEPSLEHSFIKKLDSFALSGPDYASKKEKRSQTQEIINNMLLCVQLFERGILTIDRTPLQNHLLRHLLKNHGSQIIERLCDYIACEFGINWPEDKSASSKASSIQSSDVSNDVSSKTANTNHGLEPINPESFLRLADLLKRTTLPDALSVCAGLQSLVEKLRSNLTNLSSLSDFYSSLERLAVDQLGFNLSTLRIKRDKKSDREERSRANELAIQLEMQLHDSLVEMESCSDVLKITTTAALAATCLFAQVICGWPITAQGKYVPDLVDWLSDISKLKREASDSNVQCSNSAINTLIQSSAIENLRMIVVSIAEQVRSSDNLADQSTLASLTRQVYEVATQCRKQLYK